MRIKSKRLVKLDSPIPVYDIEVPETSNFTLDSGVVVHNSKDMSDGVCGALYNASLHASEFSNISNDIEAILLVNEEKRSVSDYSTEELEMQLMNIAKKKQDLSTNNLIKDDDDIDTIVKKVTNNDIGNPNEGKVSEEMKAYYASMGLII